MSKKYNDKEQAYVSRFSKFMADHERRRLSIEARLRMIAFAILDTDCPLHCLKAKGPTTRQVVELLGDSSLTATDVGRTMVKMAGPFGILKSEGTLKLNASPDEDYSLSETYDLRVQLETNALFKIHEHSNEGKKTATIDELKKLNKAISELIETTDNVTDIEEAIKIDPEVGYYAEQFWEADRRLHTYPSEVVGMKMNKDVLEVILKRVRISAPRRLTIIGRLLASFQEHKVIIDAVAAVPSEQSRVAITNAVKAHLDSALLEFAKGS